MKRVRDGSQVEGARFEGAAGADRDEREEMSWGVNY